MKHVYLPVLAALALTACAETSGGPSAIAPPQVETSSTAGNVFAPQDFAWSTASGTGEIIGALTYHRGSVRYGCEGGDVLLTPETAWSRRRMLILYGSAASAAIPVSIVRARTPSAPTGDYARFVRRTHCDAANHFTFTGLPDGAWFVITVGKPVGGDGEAIAVTRRVETHGGSVSANLS